MGGGLDGRIVLITGAAGGIGAACARRLAAEGAHLVLADLDGPAVERLAGELGQVAVRCDVTVRADIGRMVDTAYGRWGRLDVLFNNAGVIQGKPLLDLTEEDWDRLMNVNLRAVFFVLQAAARRMLAQPLHFRQQLFNLLPRQGKAQQAGKMFELFERHHATRSFAVRARQWFVLPGRNLRSYCRSTVRA